MYNCLYFRSAILFTSNEREGKRGGTVLGSGCKYGLQPLDDDDDGDKETMRIRCCMSDY